MAYRFPNNDIAAGPNPCQLNYLSPEKKLNNFYIIRFHGQMKFEHDDVWKLYIISDVIEY